MYVYLNLLKKFNLVGFFNKKTQYSYQTKNKQTSYKVPTGAIKVYFTQRPIKGGK